MQSDQELLSWATFGRQVEHFVSSDIGSYLVKRAEAEIESAVGRLKKQNPFDTQQMLIIQNEIKVCESILNWLGDAVSAGHAAIETLKGEEDSE